jgi:hypothetical protein
MTVFGKPLSAYWNFSKIVAILILVVGILRLGLSLSGQPNSTTRLLAMNAVLFLGVIYLSVRIHLSGFGSYKQLLPSIAIPNTALHAVAITGIVIGMITGHDNVFTSPEFAFGQDGKTLLHVAAHLVIGIPVASIINWLIGCLILFITKKVVRRSA